MPTKLPKTVIGVPGQWTDRSEIVTSIAQHSDGYLSVGELMSKLDTKDMFTLEIYERDDQLRRTFELAGQGRIDEECLAAIDNHTFTLYVSSETGSVDAATKLMHAANALLRSGGLAIKVESTGVAHSTDRWNQFCEDGEPTSMIQALVTLVGGDGEFYSCGMHNLGYPDAILEADLPPNDAANLLHTFVTYELTEKPDLEDGETFSIDADAPVYRLTHQPCTMFEPDDLFHNPFGVWKISLG